MPPMTESEWKAFVLEGRRTAKLGTTRRDGSPHVVPVWIAMDEDGTILFTTGAGSVKGRAIRRDPRVALCFDDENPPYSFVLVNGTATVSEDLDEMLLWATRIAARFVTGYEMGDRGSEERELHAWAEVYVSGAGWRGYDPSQGLAVADRHVAVASGAAPPEAAPTSGTFRGGGVISTLEAVVTIRVAASVRDREQLFARARADRLS